MRNDAYTKQERNKVKQANILDLAHQLAKENESAKKAHERADEASSEFENSIGEKELGFSSDILKNTNHATAKHKQREILEENSGTKNKII